MKSTTSGLLTAFAFVSAAGSALAGTDHHMHASECFSTGGVASWTQFGFGATSTSGGATMICPLPDSWNFSGGATFTINFVAYDRNNASDVDCNLIMTDSNGNLLALIDAHTTGFASAPSPFGPMTGTVSGPGYLGCLVPAKTSFGQSYLTTYTVNL